MTQSRMRGAEQWAQFYRRGVGNVYPDENLVRLIRGNYADVPRSGRVLDVGFGIGGNLVFFAQSGFESHGLEVSQESIDAGDKLSESAGVDLKLGLMDGTRLPYEDNYFDVVVSWGAVYYHGNRTLVAEAINDFQRVIKPGGVLLLSVIHPNSFMVRRFTEDLGDGAHRIDRESPHDTRFGMEIFYSGTSTGWRELLSPFDEVAEGYAEADLFNAERRDAWRLFLAQKGLAKS
jgi:SAM-dependent methyltransferase